MSGQAPPRRRPLRGRQTPPEFCAVSPLAATIIASLSLILSVSSTSGFSPVHIDASLSLGQLSARPFAALSPDIGSGTRSQCVSDEDNSALLSVLDTCAACDDAPPGTPCACCELPAASNQYILCPLGGGCCVRVLKNLSLPADEQASGLVVSRENISATGSDVAGVCTGISAPDAACQATCAIATNSEGALLDCMPDGVILPAFAEPFTPTGTCDATSDPAAGDTPMPGETSVSPASTEAPDESASDTLSTAPPTGTESTAPTTTSLQTSTTTAAGASSTSAASEPATTAGAANGGSSAGETTTDTSDAAAAVAASAQANGDEDDGESSGSGTTATAQVGQPGRTTGIVIGAGLLIAFVATVVIASIVFAAKKMKSMKERRAASAGHASEEETHV